MPSFVSRPSHCLECSRRRDRRTKSEGDGIEQIVDMGLVVASDEENAVNAFPSVCRLPNSKIVSEQRCIDELALREGLANVVRNPERGKARRGERNVEVSGRLFLWRAEDGLGRSDLRNDILLQDFLERRGVIDMEEVEQFAVFSLPDTIDK